MPLILQYIHNLSGLLAIVTDESMLPQANTNPTSLETTVDEYLSVHGYTADVQHIIVCTFKLNTTQDGFFQTMAWQNSKPCGSSDSLIAKLTDD